MKKMSLLLAAALLCLPAVAEQNSHASRGMYRQCRQTMRDNLQLELLGFMTYAGACRSAPALVDLSGQPEHEMAQAVRKREDGARLCEKTLRKADVKRIEKELRDIAQRELESIKAQAPEDEEERKAYMTNYCTQKAKTVIQILGF